MITTRTMRNKLEIAILAAREAGNILMDAFLRPHQEDFKGTINIVTEMDKEAERLIFGVIGSAFPDDPILGEETNHAGNSKESLWIVDPLDGTTNYARGYPFFAVSIAFQHQGEILVGVVYNPLLDKLFVAEKNHGATLNGQRIRVTQTAELGKSLLATGFPYDAWTNEDNNCREWEKFIRRTLSVRCDGAASLDLCHVAAGWLDGYWENSIEAWDIAAGALIVKEAGGCISLTNGKPYDPYRHSILASNGHLHQAMLELLAPQ
jgi:myo-inositol-1(or 4)-monophosphatase